MASINPATVGRNVELAFFFVFIGTITSFIPAVFMLVFFFPLGLLYILLIILSNIFSFQGRRYYGSPRKTKFYGPFGISTKGLVVLITTIWTLSIATVVFIVSLSIPAFVEDRFFFATLCFFSGIPMLLGSIQLMYYWARMHKAGYVRIERNIAGYDGYTVTTRYTLIPYEPGVND